MRYNYLFLLPMKSVPKMLFNGIDIPMFQKCSFWGHFGPDYHGHN